MTTINVLTTCAKGLLEVRMILMQSNNSHLLELEERVVAYRVAKAPILVNQIDEVSGSLSVSHQHTWVHTNHGSIAHLLYFHSWCLQTRWYSGGRGRCGMKIDIYSGF
jgi:hypothetical protein